MEHEHLLALSVLLYLAPVAVLAEAGLERAGLHRRLSGAPAAARAAALLLLVAGGVHLGLAGGHAGELPLRLAFVTAGAAQLALAAAAVLEIPGWRPAAAAVTAGALVAYPATRILGWDEGVDALGAATILVEVCTLAAIARGARRLRVTAR